ncbi:conserved hypothetical protein [Ricinus communis]|uniref:Uncharacterized protein n=1 Tax=Ricinus communis TaxID=3988 RepID=B9T5R3_RICCO|nr:conserved hypothetical protein [Ricinus communis]
MKVERAASEGGEAIGEGGKGDRRSRRGWLVQVKLLIGIAVKDGVVDDDKLYATI